MLTVFLNGGVGNQLFQVATTCALAWDNNDTCAFDFDVICMNQGRSPLAYRNTLYRDLASLPSDWIPKVVYKESGLAYNAIPYREGMLLKGYFQSEQYFAHHGERIRDLFLDNVLLSALKIIHSDLLENSLSVHVRRGDYIRFSSTYHLLDMDYYNSAIACVDEFKTIDHILVFSDDSQWCKEHFTDKRVTVMTENDLNTLLLMSLCDHNIIANSSFSWFGAWLGEKKGKMIIAPSKWFLKSIGTDIIPDRWIKL